MYVYMCMYANVLEHVYAVLPEGNCNCNCNWVGRRTRYVCGSLGVWTRYALYACIKFSISPEIMGLLGDIWDTYQPWWHATPSTHTPVTVTEHSHCLLSSYYGEPRAQAAKFAQTRTQQFVY
jgi:hypothetical protein